MTNGKKLYKKSSDKMLCGVCSGVAEYFGVDKTLIRILVALLTLVTAFFPCLIVYIVIAIIMPDEKDVKPPFDGTNNGDFTGYNGGTEN